MLALPSYRRRSSSASAMPMLPTLGGMPIYQPPTAQQPTGIGPGGFFGFGNDMMYPDRSRPQDSSPQQTLSSVPMPGGQGVTPRYMTAGGPAPATQPTMFAPMTPVAPPPGGGTTPGTTAGPMIGNDVLIPNRQLAPQRAIRPSISKADLAAGRTGSDLFWEPSLTPPAAPQAAARPRRQYGLPNLSKNEPSQMGTLQNAPGYWHMQGGVGQDANRAMYGGPIIFDQGGNHLHNSANMPTAQQTYEQQQRMNAEQLNAQANRLGHNRFAAGAPGGGGGGAAMPVYGGGGGGIGGSFQGMHDAANAANEARYQDGHRGYTAWRRRLNDLLNGLGEQQRADTNQSYDRQRGAIMQGDIDRGLVNSSGNQNMLAGNERRRTESLARLAESLARERIAQEYAPFKDQVDFLERKTEEGPDLGLMSSLLQAYGAGGGGGGGGAAMPITVDMSGGGGMAGMGAYTPAWGQYLGPRANIQPLGGRGGRGQRSSTNFVNATAESLGATPGVPAGFDPAVWGGPFTGFDSGSSGPVSGVVRALRRAFGLG